MIRFSFGVFSRVSFRVCLGFRLGLTVVSFRVLVSFRVCLGFRLGF